MTNRLLHLSFSHMFSWLIYFWRVFCFCLWIMMDVWVLPIHHDHLKGAETVMKRAEAEDWLLAQLVNEAKPLWLRLIHVHSTRFEKWQIDLNGVRQDAEGLDFNSSPDRSCSDLYGCPEGRVFQATLNLFEPWCHLFWPKRNCFVFGIFFVII